MVKHLSLLLLLPMALWLALPAAADWWAFISGCLRRVRGGRAAEPAGEPETERLLFLVPAHNEEQLIARCIASLREQAYPGDRLHVVVVADNCADSTAVLARNTGATVLERRSRRLRGKHHAIDWALRRLPTRQYDAVVIVDADTLVAPDFARELTRHAPLGRAIVQTHHGISNEFENWLTRMAGVQTRSRWDLVLRLKAAAGLNCPLAGDGTAIGTEILEAYPYRVHTITEGWELYAAYTLAGLRIAYEPRARFYAQETKSLRQSESQRMRWTAGRLAVLRRYALRIFTQPGLRPLQRLDLLAELSSLGPVTRAFLGVLGLLAVAWAPPAGGAWVAILFAGAVLHPALLSSISLARHPDPWGSLRAFLWFPLYAAWRVALEVRAIRTSGMGAWVRTARHSEPGGVARG